MLFLPNFKSLHVAVIGDVILDQYYDCDINRVSPEAPVVIAQTNDNRMETSLGGAGNTAKNCSGLGAETTLYGFVGFGEHSDTVRVLCKKHNINEKLIPIQNINTIRKVRYRKEYQQIIRIDYESNNKPYNVAKEEYERIMALFANYFEDYNLIILSDYDKGTLHKNLCRFIINYASQSNIPVFVDPKGTKWNKYHGAECLTPNMNEFRKMTIDENMPVSDQALQKMAIDIITDYALSHILITRGKEGISFVRHQEYIYNHTDAQEVFDVSGAGDTVIAAFALCSVKRLSFGDCIKIANLAAKAVIKRSGTYAITIKELESEIEAYNKGLKE